MELLLENLGNPLRSTSKIGNTKQPVTVTLNYKYSAFKIEIGKGDQIYCIFSILKMNKN